MYSRNNLLLGGFVIIVGFIIIYNIFKKSSSIPDHISHPSHISSPISSHVSHPSHISGLNKDCSLIKTKSTCVDKCKWVNGKCVYNCKQPWGGRCDSVMRMCNSTFNRPDLIINPNNKQKDGFEFEVPGCIKLIETHKCCENICPDDINKQKKKDLCKSMKKIKKQLTPEYLAMTK